MVASQIGYSHYSDRDAARFQANVDLVSRRHHLGRAAVFLRTGEGRQAVPPCSTRRMFQRLLAMID